MFSLSTKSVSKTIKSSVHFSKKSSKRGASEVIGTMILLGVTVVGGLLVWTLFQGNETLMFSIAEPELSPIVVAQLQITGYDTRDAESLYNITGINNEISPSNSSPDVLCTITDCTNGSEFIIIKIRSDNDEAVTIRSIEINDVLHVFDSLHTTGSPDFSTAHDDDGDGTGGTLPASGEFIIISGFGGISGLKQEAGSALPIVSEKRFLIHLDTSITPNIPLNSQIRVIINSSVETTQLLLVPAGSLA